MCPTSRARPNHGTVDARPNIIIMGRVGIGFAMTGEPAVADEVIE
jgi:hypothetical protein